MVLQLRGRNSRRETGVGAALWEGRYKWVGGWVGGEKGGEALLRERGWEYISLGGAIAAYLGATVAVGFGSGGSCSALSYLFVFPCIKDFCLCIFVLVVLTFYC